MESFEIVVIGTGEAGTTTAQRLTAKGKKVAIVYADVTLKKY